MGDCARRCPARGPTCQAGKRMKAIIFATAMTIVLLAVVTMALRFHQTAQRARQMTLIYFGCVIISVLAWFTTSVDLGFLARPLLIEPAWLDFVLMLFFLTAAFFGGVLQLYNVSYRGFSLRILIHAEETASPPIDAHCVIADSERAYGLAVG